MTVTELAERDRSDIAAVFSTREGRRFFARLIQRCGVYRVSDERDCEQTHMLAYFEGERRVGLSILNWLQDADENAVVKLFEADKERKVDAWEKTE